MALCLVHAQAAAAAAAAEAAAKQCVVCKEQVTEGGLNTLGGIRHMECFKCYVCHEPLDVGGKFFAHPTVDKMALCQVHAQELSG